MSSPTASRRPSERNQARRRLPWPALLFPRSSATSGGQHRPAGRRHLAQPHAGRSKWQHRPPGLPARCSGRLASEPASQPLPGVPLGKAPSPGRASTDGGGIQKPVALWGYAEQCKPSRVSGKDSVPEDSAIAPCIATGAEDLGRSVCERRIQETQICQLCRGPTLLAGMGELCNDAWAAN